MKTATLALLISSFTANASDLPLNGSFQYRYLGMIPIFNADLHLPNDYTGPSFDPDKPVDLVFRYYRSVSKEQLIRQAEIALNSRRHPGDIERFSKQLAKLNSAYRNVNRGDRYRLNYKPTNGMALFLNEEELVTITRDGFPAFYFSIWLGEDASPSNMRKSLWADIMQKQSPTQ